MVILGPRGVDFGTSSCDRAEGGLSVWKIWLPPASGADWSLITPSRVFLRRYSTTAFCHEGSLATIS